MTGSVPFSISDPDIPPFANPNVVSHMSETATEQFDDLPNSANPFTGIEIIF